MADYKQLRALIDKAERDSRESSEMRRMIQCANNILACIEKCSLKKPAWVENELKILRANLTFEKQIH